MATTSTSARFTRSWVLSNARGTPKRALAASADSRRLVDRAVISKSSESDLKAGMCACAAQPRSGLAPMMPTRILLAPPLLITITPYRPSTTWSPLRSRRSALGDGLHVFASPDFGGQRLHGLGKVCPDLVVGQLAFLEAGVSMRHGQLEIEYPRAERGKDFAELALCPGRP